tara:strand:+ start:606 stop:785 length:180 start_codon:yes stop_codon:yes gene_type:complete
MAKRKIALERDLVLELSPNYYKLPRKRKKLEKKIITLMVLGLLINYMSVIELSKKTETV